MRALNHIQTQQAWCLALHVESDATNSRDEGSVLVDSACEVHLADEKSGRKTVPSPPLDIIAAGDHTLEHYGNQKRIPEVENGQSIELSFKESDIGKIIFSAG